MAGPADEAQIAQEMDDYSAAFGDGGAAGGDAPLGVDLPNEADQEIKDEPAVAAVALVDDDAAKEEVGDEMARAEADSQAAINDRAAHSEADTPAEQANGGSDAEKEAQRLRSWEGRLKKMEAELKAKGSVSEPAGAEALEKVAEQSEGMPSEPGEPSLSEAANEMAEKVESGEMNLDEATRALAEDFGEPFVKMIEAVARKIATEASGKIVNDGLTRVSGNVDEIISHITNERERSHFETIADAVPDFNEIASTTAFKEFCEGDPDKERIAQGGRAREVIKLLKDFKASSAGTPAPAAEPTPPAAQAKVEDPAMDAAEGVRSGGLRLPEQPKMADDYEGAWAEASRA